MPDISIATPNYNYSQYIEATIRSVCSQAGIAVEHIVVDDGSTDDSVSVVRRLQSEFPNLTLLQQVNQGQTPAINCGLSACSGNLLGWINSDDTLNPGALGIVVDYFRRNPRADVLYGDANVIDLDGQYMYRIRHLPYSYRTGAYSGFGNILTSNAVFWRRSAMERAGMFREGLRCNMDGEFFARLFHGASFAHLPIPLANFRQQPLTQAAKGDARWRETVQREVLLERSLAYGFLPESRFLPFSFSAPLRCFWRAQRMVRRAAHWHYLKKKIEMKRYRATRK